MLKQFQKSVSALDCKEEPKGCILNLLSVFIDQSPLHRSKGTDVLDNTTWDSKTKRRLINMWIVPATVALGGGGSG